MVPPPARPEAPDAPEADAQPHKLALPAGTVLELPPAPETLTDRAEAERRFRSWDQFVQSPEWQELASALVQWAEISDSALHEMRITEARELIAHQVRFQICKRLVEAPYKLRDALRRAVERLARVGGDDAQQKGDV